MSSAASSVITIGVKPTKLQQAVAEVESIEEWEQFPSEDGKKRMLLQVDEIAASYGIPPDILRKHALWGLPAPTPNLPDAKTAAKVEPQDDADDVNGTMLLMK